MVQGTIGIVQGTFGGNKVHGGVADIWKRVHWIPQEMLTALGLRGVQQNADELITKACVK
jgi:hypothetical protein